MRKAATQTEVCATGTRWWRCGTSEGIADFRLPIADCRSPIGDPKSGSEPAFSLGFSNEQRLGILDFESEISDQKFEII